MTSRNRVVSMRTDGHMAKLIVAFRNFAKSPKKKKNPLELQCSISSNIGNSSSISSLFGSHIFFTVFFSNSSNLCFLLSHVCYYLITILELR